MIDELYIAAYVRLTIKHQAWLRRHEVTPNLRECRIAQAAVSVAADTLGMRTPAIRFFRGKDFGELDRINNCLWVRTGQPADELTNTVWHELAHWAAHKAGLPIGHGKKYSPAAFAAHDPKVTQRLRRAIARRKQRKEAT